MEGRCDRFCDRSILSMLHGTTTIHSYERSKLKSLHIVCNFQHSEICTISLQLRALRLRISIKKEHKARKSPTIRMLPPVVMSCSAIGRYTVFSLPVFV